MHSSELLRDNQTVLCKDMQYAVFNAICRNLLFYILVIIWSIKILLITFCQWNQTRHFANSCEKNGWRKWAEMGRDSAQITEHVDIRSKYVGVMSQNTLSLITAPPSGGNSERQ